MDEAGGVANSECEHQQRTKMENIWVRGQVHALLNPSELYTFKYCCQWLREGLSETIKQIHRQDNAQHSVL